MALVYPHIVTPKNTIIDPSILNNFKFAGENIKLYEYKYSINGGNWNSSGRTELSSVQASSYTFSVDANTFSHKSYFYWKVRYWNSSEEQSEWSASEKVVALLPLDLLVNLKAESYKTLVRLILLNRDLGDNKNLRIKIGNNVYYIEVTDTSDLFLSILRIKLSNNVQLLVEHRPLSAIPLIYSNHNDTGYLKYSNHTDSGYTLYSDHINTGYSKYSDHNESGYGKYSDHTNSGYTLYSNHTNSGYTLYSNHTNSGYTLYSNHTNSGYTLYSDHTNSGYTLYSNHLEHSYSLYSDHNESGYSKYSDHNESGYGKYSDHNESGYSKYSNHTDYSNYSRYTNYSNYRNYRNIYNNHYSNWGHYGGM